MPLGRRWSAAWWEGRQRERTEQRVGAGFHEGLVGLPDETVPRPRAACVETVGTKLWGPTHRVGPLPGEEPVGRAQGSPLGHRVTGRNRSVVTHADVSASRHGVQDGLTAD